MSMWRIRIAIADDPCTLALLRVALADQPVSLLRLSPRDIDLESGSGPDMAEITGEVVVELIHDEGLAAMLGALHGISPQVHVSRADPPELPIRGGARSDLALSSLVREHGRARSF